MTLYQLKKLGEASAERKVEDLRMRTLAIRIAFHGEKGDFNRFLKELDDLKPSEELTGKVPGIKYG